MISVESLTKRFADAQAVNQVSFRVEKGEILGFLGPNGAGKTTTMRMLTCYVPPTSGTAAVGGYDIYEQPVEVRRQVGYLPENVPLYGEMRVEEFLRFRARLKGVARSKLTSQLDYVTERCAVAEVLGRVIDHLSKGYRQRVALADALLHEPPILILDEPTVGLDPKQIRQVRELIRDLGREHTIILSSHILPEVEQVCGRVVIINRGKIVAQDRPEALRQAIAGAAYLDVEIRGDRSSILETLGRLPGVKAVRETSDLAAGRAETRHAPASPPDIPGERRAEMPGRSRPDFSGEARSQIPGSAPSDGVVSATVESDAACDLREEIFRLAVDRGWVLLGLFRRRLSLEDIFIDLTTREDDDATASDGRAADKEATARVADGTSDRSGTDLSAPGGIEEER